MTCKTQRFEPNIHKLKIPTFPFAFHAKLVSFLATSIQWGSTVQPTKVMGVISWIFLGLIAGAIAKFVMPGKDPGGFFVTILIGIVGGVLGGFLGSFLGLGKIESFDLGGIFIATIGSILLLIIYRIAKKK